MLENRTFRVVFVQREPRRRASTATDEADKVVQYSGKQVTVTQ